MFVSVTVFAAVVWPTVAVPNAKVAGLILSGRLPVPESATVSGESGALSLTASEPVSDPEIEGVKVTFTVHEAPVPRDDPQVLLKTPKFPVAAMELILTLPALVFFRVMAFVALVVPATCALKLRVCGVGVTIGALATVNGSAP